MVVQTQTVIKHEILDLKWQRNAVRLAHNYRIPELAGCHVPAGIGANDLLQIHDEHAGADLMIHPTRRHSQLSD